MKKYLLKAAMPIALLALLAACKVNLTTPAPEDAFKANVDEYMTNPTAQSFTVEVTAGDITKFAEDDKHRVKVTFSYPVTEDGIKDGITFSSLKNADKAWEMPKTDKTITPLETKIVDKDVYFVLDTKDVKYLYIFFDASKIKAKNGAMLNMDGDDKWAEAKDDDYAFYKQIDTVAAPITGNPNYNKQCAGLNATCQGVLTPSFRYGENDNAMIVRSIEIPVIPGLFIDAEEKKAKSGTIKDLLNNHLKAEQYDWKENKWKELETKWDFEDAKDKWIATIKAEPYRMLRHKWINTDEITISLKSYGYPLKYTLKNNDERINADTAEDSGYGSVKEGDIWPGNLTSTFSSKKKIEFTLNPNTAIFNVYDNNSWKIASVDNADNTKKSLFKGFADTIKKENFKCFDNEKNPIAIKNVILLNGDPANYPYALNKIVIEFEDGNKNTASKVYMSPDVKTSAFKGSYMDGSTRKPFDIPALSFADYAPSEDTNKHGGWRKIK